MTLTPNTTTLGRCSDEAPEASALESDFLASLHHTRRLEAELRDALAQALQVWLSFQ